jgi:hypothetical protein
MWKYLGGGFLPPLPARDLTDQEAKQFGLHKVKGCNLYKHVKNKVIKTPVKVREKEGKL